MRAGWVAEEGIDNLNDLNDESKWQFVKALGNLSELRVLRICAVGVGQGGAFTASPKFDSTKCSAPSAAIMY